MMRVFADTCYWIAVLNPRERLHDVANRLSASFATERIFTSELVLTELLNSFSGSRGALPGSRGEVRSRPDGNPVVSVYPLTHSSFVEAVAFYRDRPDKSWSLTDCSSFLIMRQLGIDSALTDDRHFEQAGFRALLRE